jgi:small subunit ribosomal protein S6
LRTYELVFIAQPDLDEEALNALTERLVQVITNNGGELVLTEVLGRRRLAYLIGKWREGQYVMIHAKMERPAISELERSLKLSDEVLRHLLVRLDEVA